jgi:thymidylate synthase
MGRGEGGQLFEVIEKLKANPESRRAVVQLFDHDDLRSGSDDVPCTCVMQFLIREDQLNLIVYMRSNDALIGLPHDIFAFTMIQEIVARAVSVELGRYTHMVGSLHIYDTDAQAARDYLEEGWQDARTMPAMPGATLNDIKRFLHFERLIRQGRATEIDLDRFASAYWIDLTLLLLGLRAVKDGLGRERLPVLRHDLSNDFFAIYLQERELDLPSEEQPYAP